MICLQVALQLFQYFVITWIRVRTETKVKWKIFNKLEQQTC